MEKIIAGNPYPLVLLTDLATGAAVQLPPYELTPIAGAAQTATAASPDQLNTGGRGVKVVLDVTTIGTGSITLSIQGKDPASGKYFNLLVGAAVITNSTNVYELYPGIAAVANVSANGVLPRTWRVLVTSNNVNPVTYTVGATVLK